MWVTIIANTYIYTYCIWNLNLRSFAWKAYSAVNLCCFQYSVAVLSQSIPQDRDIYKIFEAVSEPHCETKYELYGKK